MREKKGFRLGGAEYATVESQANHAHALFFDAAAKVVPEFIPSLHEGPLPRWQSLRAAVADKHQLSTFGAVEMFAARKFGEATRVRMEIEKKRGEEGWEQWKQWEHWEQEATQYATLAKNFCDELKRWAVQWNVTKPWFLELAFGRLRYGRVYDLDSAGDRFPTPKPFTFDYEPWVPKVRPRANYYRDVRKAFTKSLKCYLDDVTIFVKAIARHTRKQAKHTKSNRQDVLARAEEKRQLLHFEWLARHVVQRWLQEAIRIEYDLPESPIGRKTVEEGIKDAARLVGLQVQPVKGGRPAGAKDNKYKRHLSEAGIKQRKMGK